MSELRKIGNTLFALAFLTGALGFSTWFWVKSSAILVEYNTQIIVQNGYPVQDPGVNPSTGGFQVNWQSVKYSYLYNGREYTSSFIGFFLPFNNELPWDEEGNKKEISAYVFPLIPAISVVKTGFDFRPMVFLVVFGTMSHFINYWLISVLKIKIT
jgi:hypothetical protein